MEALEIALAPKLIFTLIAVAIAIGPMIADFNQTHATNPLWTPHARFHVVWQVLSQAGVSAVILFLIWMPNSEQLMTTWLAAMLNYIWLASFFATLASMRLFDGALKDVNGIKPFRFNIMGDVWEVDTNLFGAVIFLILNSMGVYLLAVG